MSFSVGLYDVIFDSILSNMTKRIAVYATDTMADWEFAYLTTHAARARQAKPESCELQFVGDAMGSVRTLGGVPIESDVDLQNLELEGLSILVIPGGDTYDAGHDRLLETVRECEKRGIPVAAICGGTLALARAGLLDCHEHTSNAPEMLETTGYQGQHLYQDAPAVSDAGVITASAIFPVQFTAAVLREIELFPDEFTDAWEELYLGNSGAYPRLMEALDAWQNS